MKVFHPHPKHQRLVAHLNERQSRTFDTPPPVTGCVVGTL